MIERPGPIQVETVIAADWKVPLSGLLNLDHPIAKQAGLEDRDEPIHVYFHAIRHPEHGLFIIDTGIERALVESPEDAAIRGLVAKVMHTEQMTVHTDTATWIEAQGEPLRGVLLTHLHLDHVSGLPDVPRGVPVFVGPGETESRAAENLVVRPVFDRALEGHAALQEWGFFEDPDGRFEGVVDVFGDGSFWALHVPGHTPGSTAFVARTPEGPVLFTGDASHTAWGWEHGVEPGDFSHDRSRSADSLAKLEALVVDHPGIDVRLGHQSLPE